MPSTTQKQVEFSDSAFEVFRKLRPNNREVEAVVAALKAVASSSIRPHPLLPPDARVRPILPLDSVFRVKVGRFAIAYEVNDTVQVVAVYEP